MKIFKQVNLKRDYECTNIVAVVAEKLPERFNPDVFKETEENGALKSLVKLGIERSNGQTFELYGHL